MQVCDISPSVTYTDHGLSLIYPQKNFRKPQIDGKESQVADEGKNKSVKERHKINATCVQGITSGVVTHIQNDTENSNLVRRSIIASVKLATRF